MKDEFKKFSNEKNVSSLMLYDYKNKLDKMFGPISMTPNIIEERKMNAISLSVFDRLMMDRIIFLGMDIEDSVANVINAQLLFLESIDSEKDISIYINSGGGSVYSGLGIYDIMQYVKPDIITVCTGVAASMAAVLLCAGAKGKRSALKHARTMIHQPSSGANGTISDMEIVVEESKKLKKELYDIISFHTGQPFEKIEKDSDRDYWMSSKEAKDYKLIDSILEKNKKG